MQSNADFIPNSTKEATVLREIIKAHTKYECQDRHQQAFENLLSKFKKEIPIAYCDMYKLTFLFTDAHLTWFGVVLAQGESTEKAKPLCEETKLRNIFKNVAATVANGDTSIMGSKAIKFNHIFSELNVSGNGLLLLHKKAIELANIVAYPNQSELTRILRNNFFFYDMDKKVKNFDEKCESCNVFTSGAVV